MEMVKSSAWQLLIGSSRTVFNGKAMSDVISWYIDSNRELTMMIKTGFRLYAALTKRLLIPRLHRYNRLSNRLNS